MEPPEHEARIPCRRATGWKILLARPMRHGFEPLRKAASWHPRSYKGPAYRDAGPFLFQRRLLGEAGPRRGGAGTAALCLSD